MVYGVKPLIIALIRVTTVGASDLTKCKYLPGDANWPSRDEWATLNDTVGGRLIATVPLGSPCHDPIYDEELCTSLKEQWLYSGIQ